MAFGDNDHREERNKERGLDWIELVYCLEKLRKNASEKIDVAGWNIDDVFWWSSWVTSSWRWKMVNYGNLFVWNKYKWGLEAGKISKRNYGMECQTFGLNSLK